MQKHRHVRLVKYYKSTLCYSSVMLQCAMFHRTATVYNDTLDQCYLVKCTFTKVD